MQLGFEPVAGSAGFAEGIFGAGGSIDVGAIGGGGGIITLAGPPEGGTLLLLGKRGGGGGIAKAFFTGGCDVPSEFDSFTVSPVEGPAGDALVSIGLASSTTPAGSVVSGFDCSGGSPVASMLTTRCSDDQIRN